MSKILEVPLSVNEEPIPDKESIQEEGKEIPENVAKNTNEFQNHTEENIKIEEPPPSLAV